MRNLMAPFGGLVLASLLPACSVIPGHHVSASANESRPLYDVVTITPDVIASERLLQRSSLNQMAELSQPDPTGTPEYRVGPGDVISIIVWDHPELTNPAGEFRDPVSAGRLVASDGTMFYPHVGRFKAAGLTTNEIAQYISAILAKVIQHPQVDARIAAFRSQRVQVTGAVRQPGIVALDDTTKGVIEAINERGGLGEEASRGQALITRDGRTYRIDLMGLLSGDRGSANPPLRHGDIVHIPDSSDDQVFVLGELVKPAPVPIRQRAITLTEALTATGGMSPTTADDSGVLVFRRAGTSGKARIFALDMSTPEGVLLAGEFDLAPRDVVYVQATAFSQYNSVIGQILPTISALFQLDVLLDQN